MKGAAVNIGMHVSFPIIVLSSYRPRSEIAGLYVNQGFLCSFKKLTYLNQVLVAAQGIVAAHGPSICGLEA